MNNLRATGFTLIEMMIGVAIIAVLSAIAIPLYQGHVAEARFQTAIQDIRQFEIILNDLAHDFDLQAIEPSGYAGAVLEVYLHGNGLALGSASTPPAGATRWYDPWKHPYRYQRSTTTNSGVRTDSSGNVTNDAANWTAPQSYDLFSQGPDTSSSTDDVIRGCNGEYVGSASGLSGC